MKDDMQHIRIVAEKFVRLDVGKYKKIDRKTKVAYAPDARDFIEKMKAEGYHVTWTVYYKK